MGGGDLVCCVRVRAHVEEHEEELASAHDAKPRKGFPRGEAGRSGETEN